MNRIEQQMVNISHPFRLEHGSRTYPPGTYEITTEQEPLGDLVFDAFRRVSIRIYLPPVSGSVGIGEILEIDPEELGRLLESRCLD